MSVVTWKENPKNGEVPFSQKKIEAPRSKVTVRKFFNAGRGRLQLSLVAGEAGLDKEIPEPMPYRPGLALSGFLGHFAPGRIQVIGLSEYEYLKSLSEDVRVERIEAIFRERVPCIVFARGQQVFPEVTRLAEKDGVPVFVTELETKIFFNNGTFLLEELHAPRRIVHGTVMEVDGVGVFIEGDPGLGKSETALGLIMRGHALVADDAPEFRLEGTNKVIASAKPATLGYMEIRGLGFLEVPVIFGVAAVRGEKQVDLVITLVPQSKESDMLDRTNERLLERDVLGVKIPQRVIPVAPGRDLVNVVETAARQFKRDRSYGGNATKALDDQIKQRHAALARKEGE